MTPTTSHSSRHRRATLLLALWCVVALLGIWLAQAQRTLRLSDTRAGTGWYGIETTPDTGIRYRWTAPSSNISMPAGSAGWARLQLRLTTAAPGTTVRIGVTEGATQTIPVASGGFRSYQLLLHLPVAWSDTQRISMTSTPAVADGSRSLGVAIAGADLWRLSAWPGLPPPYWIALVLANTALLGWAVQRWGLWWGYGAWLLSAAAWLAGSAGIVPFSMPLLSAGGAAIGVAAALLSLRRLVQQALPFERRLRRSLAAAPRLVHAGTALGLVCCAALLWQLFPATTRYAPQAGPALFFLILLGLPLVIALRTRLARLAPLLVWGVAVGATIGLGVVFWRIYTRQLDGSMLSDLPLHMLDARRLMLDKVTVNYAVWVNGAVAYTTQNGNRWVSIPHPLFHWALGLVAFVMRDDVYWRAMPVTLLLFQGLAVGMLYAVVRSVVGRRIGAAWVWLLALTLHVIAAVYLPAINPMIYRGQGSVTIFHNATTIVAKPVTWLALGVALLLLQPHIRRPMLWAGVAVLCMVAATLAKPNGPLAIVPALWALVACSWLAGRRLPRTVWLLVLPTLAAVCVLALQSTVRSNGGSDFAVGWLRAALLSSPHPFVSLLQLCAFPLLTLLLAPPLWRDRRVLVVVFATLIAMLQYLVFFEPAQITANNFAWGLRIVIPLWHALALGWLLRCYSRPRVTVQTHVLAAVYGLHLMSGALYLVQLLVSNSYL